MGHKKDKSMKSSTSTETDGPNIICPNCERAFVRVDLLTEHVSFARCAGTGQTTTKKKKRTGRAANTKTKSTKKHKK